MFLGLPDLINSQKRIYNIRKPEVQTSGHIFSVYFSISFCAPAQNAETALNGRSSCPAAQA